MEFQNLNSYPTVRTTNVGGPVTAPYSYSVAHEIGCCSSTSVK